MGRHQDQPPDMSEDSKYSAEQGVSEATLKRGMEADSKEFVEIRN
jgi:hypothetical protein